MWSYWDVNERLHPPKHPLRLHDHARNFATAFGTDSFGRRAEAFARFFGTPFFLIAQTVVVIIWIVLNITGVFSFDLYPFILLNLAFSLQAAYAAPLILLAQTRQADREHAISESDAMHREEIARVNLDQQRNAADQLVILHSLLEQNNQLTALTHELSERISAMTIEMNDRLKNSSPSESLFELYRPCVDSLGKLAIFRPTFKTRS